MEYLVSILCLAYNHESYIRNCLEGFVTQETGFPFEVLINDDASKDGTAEIIREYEKRYPAIVKPIYQVENQYSKGGNIIAGILLPNAKGKYIALCEGDDYWIDKRKLQKQVEALKAHPECNMCVHKVMCVREHGESANRSIPEFELSDGTVSKEHLIGRYNFHTSSYFFRKEIFEERWREAPEFAKYCTGDVAYLLFCASKGEIYYLNEAMSCYRQNSVGSWVDRRTNESRVYFHNNMGKCYELYDTYTDYRMHDYLVDCISREQYWAALFQKKILTVFSKKNRKYLREIRGYYLLLAFFPHFVKKIKLTRRKIREYRFQKKKTV